MEINADFIMLLPPDILRIAFRNLISNAIKFSFENSKIEINIENNKLIVRDFGKGMTKEKTGQLFTSEVDTDLGTKNEEGFGMGLYIISELLLKYNHKIEVVSKQNQGSEFSIAVIFTENP